MADVSGRGQRWVHGGSWPGLPGARHVWTGSSLSMEQGVKVRVFDPLSSSLGAPSPADPPTWATSPGGVGSGELRELLLGLAVELLDCLVCRAVEGDLGSVMLS